MNVTAQQTEFLTWKVVPARLDATQAAWFLGFEPQEIPMLVAAGLLKPLGHPATAPSSSRRKRLNNSAVTKSGWPAPAMPLRAIGGKETPADEVLAGARDATGSTHQRSVLPLLG
jgi:hypothetical protein